MVTTERLCAVSSDQSSRRTPSTCMAATICWTLAGVGAFGEVGDAFDDGFRIHFGQGLLLVYECYFHQVYPRENWTLALTPGLRSPSEALEMWMALAPKSMERRGRRK